VATLSAISAHPVMGTIGWIASGLACGFLPQMLGYSDISPTNIPLLMPPAAPRCSASLPCSCRIRRRKAGKLDLKVMLGLDALILLRDKTSSSFSSARSCSPCRWPSITSSPTAISPKWA
jgi:hypothetical protein